MISIAAPDLRGELLDSRYRLDELVGFGGSGNVYAAVDLRLRKSDRFASASDFDSALVSLLQEHGVDVDRSDALAGCGEAQGSLEAWSNFEHERALAQAERAMRLDPGWSPLAMLLEIARAAAG